MSFRNVCFTIFPEKSDNLSIEERNRDFLWWLDRVPTASDDGSFTFEPADSRVKFVVYQREICPTTGLHHYQGYIEFKKNLTRKQIQEDVLGVPDCHVAKRQERYPDLKPKPPAQQQADCIKYCSKLETRVPESYDINVVESYAEFPEATFDDNKYKLAWQWGELAVQGFRSDVKKVTSSVLNNITSDTNVGDFACANPELYVKFHGGIDKLVYHHKKPRDFRTETFIYWGASDAGKTYRVYADAKAANQSVYKKPNGQWWDGYDGQHTVLIDDYDSDCLIKLSEFLQLNDSYPHQVPIKGGFRQFNSKRIIITSNYDPVTWYPNLKVESAKALFRRIDKVEYFIARGKSKLQPVNQLLVRYLQNLPSESDYENGDEHDQLPVNIREVLPEREDNLE